MTLLINVPMVPDGQDDPTSLVVTQARLVREHARLRPIDPAMSQNDALRRLETNVCVDLAIHWPDVDVTVAARSVRTQKRHARPVWHIRVDLHWVNWSQESQATVCNRLNEHISRRWMPEVPKKAAKPNAKASTSDPFDDKIFFQALFGHIDHLVMVPVEPSPAQRVAREQRVLHALLDSTVGATLRTHGSPRL